MLSISWSTFEQEFNTLLNLLDRLPEEGVVGYVVDTERGVSSGILCDKFSFPMISNLVSFGATTVLGQVSGEGVSLEWGVVEECLITGAAASVLNNSMDMSDDCTGIFGFGCSGVLCLCLSIAASEGAGEECVLVFIPARSSISSAAQQASVTDIVSGVATTTSDSLAPSSE